MKTRIGILILCVLLCFGIFPEEVYAAKNTEDIVLLYENDVHGAVEGYSKLSAMKKELQKEYDYQKKHNSIALSMLESLFH